MVFVFSLSHGQAQVERGFSINSECTTANIKEESLIARRRIYDFLQVLDQWSHEFVITYELRLSCKSAHSKYVQYNEKQKDAAEKLSGDAELKRLQDEIDEVKSKRNGVQDSMNCLQEAAEKVYEEIERESNPKARKDLAAQGNSFPKTIGEKRKLVSDLESAISKLEAEKN